MAIKSPVRVSDRAGEKTVRDNRKLLVNHESETFLCFPSEVHRNSI